MTRIRSFLTAVAAVVLSSGCGAGNDQSNPGSSAQNSNVDQTQAASSSSNNTTLTSESPSPPGQTGASGATEILGPITVQLTVPDGYSDRKREHLQSDGLTFDSVTWGPPAGKANKTRPELFISVNTGSGGNLPPTLKATDFVNMHLASYPRRWKKFNRMQAQEVVLDGKKFGRAEWEAQKDDSSSNAVHGVSYVAMVDSKTIVVECKDPSSSKAGLKQSEQALKSLKLK